MIRLIRTEILKLKNSYMMLIGFAGSAVVPFLAFMVYMTNAGRKNGIPEMADYFRQSLVFDALLIGFMLYGLIISFVFNREFQEDTMKSILPVPVGRIRLLVAKLAVVLLWVEFLMLFTVAFIVVLGSFGGFTNLTAELVGDYTIRFLLTGVFFTLLSTPVIFIILLLKSYVPAIAFTIVITIVNIFIGDSEYSPLYPWTAAAGIVLKGFFENPYPDWVPWLTVGIMTVLSVGASFFLFHKRDVQ